MTETYDLDTMKAIIAEARRQGYPDIEIARRLEISMMSEAFGHETDEDKLRAEIQELVGRRGHSLEGIAHRRDMPLSEVVRLYGDPVRRVGLDEWAACCVGPEEAHHENAILRLIDRGRQSLKNAHCRKNLAKHEILALMVDTVGLAGTHAIIAACMRLTGDMDATARTLRLPREAVKAVVWGSWPTCEAMPTLQ